MKETRQIFERTTPALKTKVVEIY